MFLLGLDKPKQCLSRRNLNSRNQYNNITLLFFLFNPFLSWYILYFKANSFYPTHKKLQMINDFKCPPQSFIFFSNSYDKVDIIFDEFDYIIYV